MEQPPVAGLLKGQCPLNQHPHIGLPLAAARLGGQIVAVSGVLEKLLDELMDRQKFRALPVSPETLPEFCQALP